MKVPGSLKVGRLRSKERMTMKLAIAPLLFTLVPLAAWAQVNVGTQKPEASLPFNMTTVSPFELSWRIAFLPDGSLWMLEDENPGALLHVTPK